MVEVSEDVSRGLALLGQGELSAPAAFRALVDVTLDVLVREKPAAAVLEAKALAQVDRIALKQAHAALVALFLVAARDAADDDALRSCLEDARVPAAHASLAAERFSARRDQLRGLSLAPVSLARGPRVVDVEWRLDYAVKQRSLERVNEPLFLVRLHTQRPDTGARDAVDFACTVDELQDLVSKLRDAAKQVERSAAIFLA